MARPRKQDKRQILAAAWDLFRVHGYEASSIKDIERATGQKAGSLYNDFGSKQGLMVRAVEAYIVDVVRPRIEKYLCDPDPLNGIRQLFLTTFNEEAPDIRGCLLTNTATEFSDSGNEISVAVAMGFEELRAGFEEAYMRAQNMGIANGALSSRAAAEFLLLGYQGVLVLARANHSSEDLQKSVDFIIQCLEKEHAT